MVQAAAGSQPLWVSSGQNSLDVINFDDNARKMINTTTTETGSQPITYAMVYKPLGTTISNVLGTGSPRCDYYDFVSGGSLHRIYAGTVLNDNTNYASQYWQLTNIFNGVSSKMRRDGSQTSTGNAGADANNGQAFGSDGSGDGFIMAEFIMYDKEVTGSELVDLETYLNEKWAVPITTWSPTMTGLLHEQSVPNTDSAGAVFNSGLATPPISNSYSDVTFEIQSVTSTAGTITFQHYDTDGTVLATTGSYDTSNLTTSYQAITLSFSSPITILDDQGIVCDNTSNNGTIKIKANTSTSTSNYSSCQQIPTYIPTSAPAAIGNYIEITLS
jgi:hypothetical protein